MKKKTKFVDILEKTNLIRKRIKDQITRRNKSYYTHSFNLYSPKNIDYNEEKAKENLNNFVLNNSLYFDKIEKDFNLKYLNVPKAKIPESLKFGDNPNKYYN